MGMDVFGEQPTADAGRYFRRAIWGWHPLAELCEELVPDIASHCADWHGNSGCGLDAEQASLLAERLRGLLADGTVAGYIDRRDRILASLPRQLCVRCDGLGTTRFNGEETACKNCEGSRTQPSYETLYGVDETDVREWIAFLQACGGFSIS